MKYFPILLLFTFLVHPLSGQHENDFELKDFIFQELDKRAMKIWLGAKNEDSKKVNQVIPSFEKEWNYVRTEILKRDFLHINSPKVVQDLDGYIELLYQSVSLDDYTNIENLSYLVLNEFREIRQCFFSSLYPLDQLWDVIDSYNEVDFTIDDKMMNLKEWFEFEDIVNKLVCDWESYELIHISNIKEYYPGINKRTHSETKYEVNNCLLTLFKAIETSFQSKFELPCDELGNSLNKMIELYANSLPSSLM